MLSVNYSLYKYSSSSHGSIFNFTIPLLDHDVSDFIMSHLLTESNDENITLHITPALLNFVKFWLEVRMHPLSDFFKNYYSSSLQKERNVVRRQGSYGTGANRQADTQTHVYIYIYIFISFIVLATSHPSRRSQKKKSTLSTKLVRKIISLKVKNNLES